MEGLFQPVHLLVILAIVLVIFGPSKLPELGKGLGQAIRGFKTAMHEDDAPPSPRPPAAQPPRIDPPAPPT